MKNNIVLTPVVAEGKTQPEWVTKIKASIPFVGLLLVVLFFQIISKGRLFSSGNIPVLINDVFTVMLGALGMSFLMAQGMFDLSMASTAAICGITISLVTPYSIWLALPVALLTGLFIGLINGFIVSRLRVPDLVGTLAMSYTLTGVAELFLGKGSGSKAVSAGILVFDNIILKFITLILVALLCLGIYNYTSYGIKCKAIGSRRQAAKLSGVKVSAVITVAYIITGIMSGLVAFFSVSRSATSSIETGFNLHFNAMLALTIGGMSLAGGASSRFRYAIIGGLCIGVIANGLSLWGLSSLAQQLIRGIIFISVIAITLNRKKMENIK